jgi:chitin disaccharide deacetylase
MTRYLIINADDFGWDSMANNAILELAKKKKITGTTVMANMVSSEDLISLGAIPDLSVGLHINLLAGKPLLPSAEVQSLVAADGTFLPQKQLLIKAIQGKIKEREVEKEVTAQWEHLQSYGIRTSHADSHKHVHQYPVIGKYILNTLKKIGVAKVRKCDVVKYTNSKNLSIKLFHLLTAKGLLPFKTPDKLVSDFSLYRSASIPIFNKAMDAAFAQHSVVEFMTHPALENRPDSYLNRKAEYNFWLNAPFDTYLQERNIELVGYREL